MVQTPEAVHSSFRWHVSSRLRMVRSRGDILSLSRQESGLVAMFTCIELEPCLVTKIKITNLSHRMRIVHVLNRTRILHALSIKSRHKKINYIVCL